MSSDKDQLIPFAFRIRAGLVEELDEWVAEQNRGRTTELTRSDVIRGVLTWAARMRPEWDTPKQILIVLDGVTGAVLLRQQVDAVGGVLKFKHPETGQEQEAYFACVNVIYKTPVVPANDVKP